MRSISVEFFPEVALLKLCIHVSIVPQRVERHVELVVVLSGTLFKVGTRPGFVYWSLYAKIGDYIMVNPPLEVFILVVKVIEALKLMERIVLAVFIVMTHFKKIILFIFFGIRNLERFGYFLVFY